MIDKLRQVERPQTGTAFRRIFFQYQAKPTSEANLLASIRFFSFHGFKFRIIDQQALMITRTIVALTLTLIQTPNSNFNT